MKRDRMFAHPAPNHWHGLTRHGMQRLSSFYTSIIPSGSGQPPASPFVMPSLEVLFDG
jgi:hypothetical protein